MVKILGGQITVFLPQKVYPSWFAFPLTQKALDVYYENIITFGQTLNLATSSSLEKSAAKDTELNKEKSLYLNRDGVLWREPKNRYTYKIKIGSDRYKTIEHLVKNSPRFIRTIEIVNTLFPKKDTKTFRDEVWKINRLVEDKLGIQGLIEGKDGSGYRINPNYKITLE